MASEVGSLNVRIGANVDDFTRKILRIADELGIFERKVAETANRVDAATAKLAGDPVRVRFSADSRELHAGLERASAEVKAFQRATQAAVSASLGGGAPSSCRAPSRPCNRRVYPRLRGDHLRMWVAGLATVGLPPPARGAPADRLAALAQRRSTPACAGSTTSSRRRTSTPSVYPRLRGEHYGSRWQRARATGLPPPARGARRKHGRGDGRTWSTPACAGSTARWRWRTATAPVYPRLRGEHDPAAWRRELDVGLPPPARGAHPVGRAARRGGGSTPACAGSTCPPVHDAGVGRVYPRLRGDHIPEPLAGQVTLGLPPPARGSPARQVLAQLAARSTPACAGITTAPGCSSRTAAVYPRLRGDHSGGCSVADGVAGLPPPARGSLWLDLALDDPGRSTPACAGITDVLSPAAMLLLVYPRLRGDHTGQRRPGACRRGLPPPARGSRRDAARRDGVGGSTPACAGITDTVWTRIPAGPVYPRLRGDHVCGASASSVLRGLPPPARGSLLQALQRGFDLRSTPACAGITAPTRCQARTAAVYPRLRGDHGAPTSP